MPRVRIEYCDVMRQWPVLQAPHLSSRFVNKNVRVWREKAGKFILDSLIKTATILDNFMVKYTQYVKVKVKVKGSGKTIR